MPLVRVNARTFGPTALLGLISLGFAYGGRSVMSPSIEPLRPVPEALSQAPRTEPVRTQSTAPQVPPGILVNVDDVEGPHGRDWPLLIRVVLSNPRAANAQTWNQMARATLENLQESGRLAKMTEADRKRVAAMYAPVNVAPLVVGSRAAPLASLFLIELRDPAKRSPTIKARALADARTAEDADLTQGSVSLNFGIDSAQLGQITGTREVVATLDTTARAGMWQGTVLSTPVSVTIVANPGGPSALRAIRDYVEGRYHLMDQQPVRAKAVADRVLAREPASVGGLTLLADAEFASNKVQEAAAAYERALDAFSKALAARKGPIPQDADHPGYLLARLKSARDLLAGRK